MTDKNSLKTRTKAQMSSMGRTWALIKSDANNSENQKANQRRSLQRQVARIRINFETRSADIEATYQQVVER